MEFMDYQPGAAALARLPKVDFVAVIGPTGAGKTTLLEGAIGRDPSIHLMLSTTSRPPRPGEQDGIDYHFLTEEQIRGRIRRREFVSVAPRVLGDIYATAPEDYATAGVAAAAIIADGMPAFLALPFKRIRQLFVLPPDWETWQTRIQAHNFMPEQIAKRMDEAGKSLLYAQSASDLLFVINDDQKQATEAMLEILQRGTSLVSPAAGRSLSAELYRRLKDSRND